MSAAHCLQFPPATTSMRRLRADSALQQLFGQLPRRREETIWLGKLKELIDEFPADVIWQDFNLKPNQRRQSGQTSLPTTTTRPPRRGGCGGHRKGRAIATAPPGTHKAKCTTTNAVVPGDITTPLLAHRRRGQLSSWCYNAGDGYYAVNAEVHTFVDHVSKGGNLLLNISPLPDGTIPQQQKDILNGFGRSECGRANYLRHPSMDGLRLRGRPKSGEARSPGPSAMTASDIRYTKSKNGDAVYAILGGWPSGGQVI